MYSFGPKYTQYRFSTLGPGFGGGQSSQHPSINTRLQQQSENHPSISPTSESNSHPALERGSQHDGSRGEASMAGNSQSSNSTGNISGGDTSHADNRAKGALGDSLANMGKNAIGKGTMTGIAADQMNATNPVGIGVEAGLNSALSPSSIGSLMGNVTGAIGGFDSKSSGIGSAISSIGTAALGLSAPATFGLSLAAPAVAEAGLDAMDARNMEHVRDPMENRKGWISAHFNRTPREESMLQGLSPRAHHGDYNSVTGAGGMFGRPGDGGHADNHGGFGVGPGDHGFGGVDGGHPAAGQGAWGGGSDNSGSNGGNDGPGFGGVGHPGTRGGGSDSGNGNGSSSGGGIGGGMGPGPAGGMGGGETGGIGF